MARIEQIQAKIDRGRGKAGLILGQQFDIYRLNAKTTGQLVQPSNLIMSKVRMQFNRIEDKKDIETNLIIKVPLFRALCNVSQFQIGDVAVQRTDGFRPDAWNGTITPGAFTLVYDRPLRQYVWMQTPLPVTLTRSENNPTKIDNGRTPVAAMGKRFEQILVLNNGNYSWSATGTPTTVYIGMVGHDKLSELPPANQRLPTDVKRQRWDVYSPLLPGVQLMESDIVNAANGDRYYILFPFVQYIGLQGWQLITEKLRV